MKQFKLSIIITVLMSMTGLQAFADWDTATKIQVDGLYYYLDEANQQAQVTSMPSGKYTGEIEIPSSFTYNETTYSVTFIGGKAFSLCSDLNSVTIPNSVTSIAPNAFTDCSGLTSMIVESENTTYDSRDNCNAIIETASNTLVSGCKNTTIPNSVTTIGSQAFIGCSSLTSIDIPNSVTTIGSQAFAYCIGLTSVTIANSVTTIGSQAFDITAWYYSQPDGLVYAGKVAYKYKGIMPANTEISIKEGTLGIASSAFEYCANLTGVIIPNSVTSIGNYAFSYCSRLTSITIPNSVTSIDNWAFSYCSGLTSVTFPNSVTSIGDYAFRECSGLSSVTFPNSVTSIGNWAFADCSGLSSVTFPNSVTSIGNYAFRNCSGLSSVTFPNSVTSIGWEAFSGCSNLTSVTVYRTSPVAISNSVFTNRTNATLYVSKGSKSAYQAADYWNEFKEIIELEATGIKTIDLSLTPDSSPKDEGSEYWYDLQGHRIVNPSNGQLPKGIYIHQGKKIVVK